MQLADVRDMRFGEDSWHGLDLAGTASGTHLRRCRFRTPCVVDHRRRVAPDLASRVPRFWRRAQLVPGPEEVRNRLHAEQQRTVVTGDRASVSQRPAVRAATLRRGEVPNLQYGTAFQVRIVRRDDESVALLLLGELDVTSMGQFERMISEVLSESPKELLFDLTQSQFISAQGYAAIGHCSLQVPVTIRSRTALASKVLAIYGYERVAIAVEREPAVNPPC